MTARLTATCLGLGLLAAPLWAANGFDIVTLGATGGLEDGNLSAYMIAPHGDPRAVTCDAGSLINGIRVADEKGAFKDMALPADSSFTMIGHVFSDVIKGYFISHAHLDHIAGLIIGSPDDSAKPIYALPSVLANIETSYFNWKAWPNFGKTGAEPHLGKYDYVALTPGETRAIDNTAMTVRALPLSHGGVESTAFLFDSDGEAVLCFGDTGPDTVEKTDRMHAAWAAAAPYVKAGKLKAVIIESSYASDREDKLLFGHLTPRYVLEGLQDLAGLAGVADLGGLPVIISHIKFQIKSGPLPQETVLKELEAGNTLKARFIIPEQGMSWHFE